MKIILRNTKLEFQAGTFDVTPFVEGGQSGVWADTGSEHPEWKDIIVDSEEKILWGRYKTEKPDYAPNLGDATIDGVLVSKIVSELIKMLPA